jgi:hypothetical protein
MNEITKAKRKAILSTPIKYLMVLALFLGLAALLFFGRLVWFYPHLPLERATVPSIDEANIAPELAQYQPFKDKPVAGNGRVIIDLSHENNLEVNDLSPLRDRLEARGVTIVTHSGTDDSLRDQLRDATALVIVAPTTRYSAEERGAIVDFVEDGGLLLLAADPTRPVPEYDEFDSLYAALYPTSAVPVINSVASAFGVIYYDDYLYNLEDNAGNFRNVRFVALNKRNALTKGLDTVVFFACHSLRSDGVALVVGDANTLSSVRTGETDLAAATLSADGHVLSLGDVTFMTPPYHTVEDNDHFLSNIADWLAVDRRLRDDIEDFPYLFGRPVDLVPVGDDLLDPQLVTRVGEWQAFFDQAGLTLSLRTEVESGHDAIFISTFDKVEPIEDHLSDAGVTVTLVEEEEEPTRGGVAEEEETPKSHITIEGMGSIGIEGTSLLALVQGDDSIVLIALAEDTEAAIETMERLITHDITGCVQADAVTVCSSGEGPRVTKEPVEEPGDEEIPTTGRIFILEDDDKAIGSRTGAAEFEAILSPRYDVTVWSMKNDGIPEYEDMTGYDVCIVDSGDYAAEEDNYDALLAMQYIEQGGVMFIGAQPLAMPEEDQLAPIDDLQVDDASHPLAAGFALDEPITLLPSESGVPATVMSQEDTTEESQIVFRRGPDSVEAGTPAVVTISQEYYGESVRLVLATFAFYRLPEDAQRTFALNAVEWMMGTE